MLKMYQGQSSSSSTPEFWDESWEQNELAQVLADVRVVENDPVYELLSHALRPDRLFLEGGCGQSQWVKYFSERGYRTIGIDFAQRTVEKVRAVAPELDVRVGNILELPFGDGEVHSYYSGGVVEHFESGPEPALREARRVLSPDGWFLCSVPDDSFLRRRLFDRDCTERRDLTPPLAVRRVGRTHEEPALDGYQFFQYAFTEDEFRRRLDEAGFAVERTFGYSLIWGLAELPRFRALYDGAFNLARTLGTRLRPASAPSLVGDDDAAGTPRVAAGPGGFLHRVLVKEDRSAPVLGPLVGLLCEGFANMRMYVARPRG
jgi:SAM-dependent methyltransferase